jgi:hypothetical protein
MHGIVIARTLGIVWLACSLTGPIVGIIGSDAAGRPIDLGQLAAPMIVVNAVNAAVAWFYVWSYRVRCRGRAHFALKAMLPNLALDSPLLCLVFASGVSWLCHLPRPLERWDKSVLIILTAAIACVLFAAASTWMYSRPRLCLASLAAAGIASSAFGLLCMIQYLLEGSVDLGPVDIILLNTAITSIPSLWMAVAFLWCLKTEPAAWEAS